MESYLEEEELLQKRLEELEDRYKQTLFSNDSLVDTLEQEIVDDSKNKKQGFRQLQNWKIENQDSDLSKKKVPDLKPKSLVNYTKNSLNENSENTGFLKKIFSTNPKNNEKEGENIKENLNVKETDSNWPKKIIQGDNNRKVIIEEEKKQEKTKFPEVNVAEQKMEEPKVQDVKVLEVKVPEIKSPELKIQEIKKPIVIPKDTDLDPMKITLELTEDLKNPKKDIEKKVVEDKDKLNEKIKNDAIQFEIELKKDNKDHKDDLDDGRPTEEQMKKFAEKIKKIKKEVSKALVGQEDIVDGMIMGLICNSHVLVEGVPGVAKTLAIKTLASVIGCDVKRVQFTVDLLPTDILGITTYTPEKGFEILKGPIFTNFMIADEINRAPPKTQSALIEAMQEKQVSIGRERFMLPAPFFVMATENPIENSGVYPLPEAQIDRFLLKLIMHYPKFDEELKILDTNMTSEKFEDFGLQAVVTPQEIIEIQELSKKIYVDDSIRAYILSIVRKTRDKDFSMSEYISYGSSPRASIGLYIASKARALMEGRNYVIPEDVKKVAFNVLRHRLIMSYKANIKKISEDAVVQDILNSVKVD